MVRRSSTGSSIANAAMSAPRPASTYARNTAVRARYIRIFAGYQWQGEIPAKKGGGSKERENNNAVECSEGM
jgi:hypothetical protein